MRRTGVKLTVGKNPNTMHLLYSALVKLNVDPSGPALDLEVPLEIIIGTIPLRQVVQQFPPRAPSPLQPLSGFHQPTSGQYAGASSQPLDPSAPWEPVMPSNIPNMRMLFLRTYNTFLYFSELHGFLFLMPCVCVCE